jgi:hypothetical protein
MTDFLLILFGVELVIGVVAFLAGGPWGIEDVVHVFIGANVCVAVLALACWLISMGVN